MPPHNPFLTVPAEFHRQGRQKGTEAHHDIFQEYHFRHIPVVNEKNQLIGLIDNNDILPAIEEEVTEDIYNMYGIQKTDESYIYSSV